MRALGWDDEWAREAAAHDPSWTPARVAIEHRGAYDVISEAGSFVAEIPGRAYREAAAKDKRSLPSVGDWVLVSGADASVASGSSAIVRAVLPRRGLLVRAAAGEKTAPQPLAANVDLGFVVTSANKDLSPRRLERYLAFVRGGGARPIIVLNKIDLVEDPMQQVRAIEAAAPGIPIAMTSAARGEASSLLALVTSGVTAVLCGSSGVGKSTLVNALAAAATPTQSIKSDTDRGRHTTARRELFVLPGGGVVIDTPGMRELALWDDADEHDAFDDIEALAAQCKFADCRHDREPGCAVRDRIDPPRLAAFRKLAAESSTGAERRDGAAKRTARVAAKALRKRVQEKDKP
ncbi:MAG TPA: ribosome small subunit-dependent GTPase A [Kofleriaceae bacterium]|nr:ribosome small subunit-dependent GTPase A [Kofleriaceae bacterium]